MHGGLGILISEKLLSQLLIRPLWAKVLEQMLLNVLLIVQKFALESSPLSQCRVLTEWDKENLMKNPAVQLQRKFSKSYIWIVCKIMPRKFKTSCKNFCHGNCGEAHGKGSPKQGHLVHLNLFSFSTFDKPNSNFCWAYGLFFYTHPMQSPFKMCHLET